MDDYALLMLMSALLLKCYLVEKIYIFRVVYKSPSHSYGSVQFVSFCSNINSLHENIIKVNPHCMFFAHHYICHLQMWNNKGITYAEGRVSEELASLLGPMILFNIIED